MQVERATESTQELLPSETITRLCESALGADHGVLTAVELAGGYYNTTYRLDRGSGDPLILRVAPEDNSHRPSERHLMRNEYASIPFLLPVADLMPTTLVADFTHGLIDRDFLIQTHLTGAPASTVQGTWTQGDQAHLWRSIGTILHRIHGVTADTYGRVMAPTADSWSGCLDQQFSAMAQGCHDLNVDAADLVQVAACIPRDREELDLIRPAHLLHGDLIPGNVMVDPEQPSRGVVGIYDCDRTVQDIVFHGELDDDGDNWPSMTVYFHPTTS